MDFQKGEPVIGLLSFLSFAFSVIAAVIAIDMYALLRTGQFGKTWRLLIIATVMFALMQALRLAEILNFQTFQRYHLSEVVELMFVISLTYAFYLQRSVFMGREQKGAKRATPTLTLPIESPTDAPDTDSRATDTRADEWAHLTGHYDGPLPMIEETRSAPEMRARDSHSSSPPSQPRIAS